MDIARVRDETMRIPRRARRYIASAAIQCTAMSAWAVAVLGWQRALPVFVPFFLAAFVYSAIRSGRRSVSAQHALASPGRLLPFYRAHLDERIRALQIQRTFGPALVLFAWACVVVLGVRGTALYWFGAVIVSALVLGGAVLAQMKLPRVIDEKKRLA